MTIVQTQFPPVVQGDPVTPGTRQGVGQAVAGMTASAQIAAQFARTQQLAQVERERIAAQQAISKSRLDAQRKALEENLAASRSMFNREQTLREKTAETTASQNERSLNLQERANQDNKAFQDATLDIERLKARFNALNSVEGGVPPNVVAERAAINAEIGKRNAQIGAAGLAVTGDIALNKLDIEKAKDRIAMARAVTEKQINGLEGASDQFAKQFASGDGVSKYVGDKIELGDPKTPEGVRSRGNSVVRIARSIVDTLSNAGVIAPNDTKQEFAARSFIVALSQDSPADVDLAYKALKDAFGTNMAGLVAVTDNIRSIADGFSAIPANADIAAGLSTKDKKKAAFLAETGNSIQERLTGLRNRIGPDDFPSKEKLFGTFDTAGDIIDLVQRGLIKPGGEPVRLETGAIGFQNIFSPEEAKTIAGELDSLPPDLRDAFTSLINSTQTRATDIGMFNATSEENRRMIQRLLDKSDKILNDSLNKRAATRRKEVQRRFDELSASQGGQR